MGGLGLLGRSDWDFVMTLKKGEIIRHEKFGLGVVVKDEKKGRVGVRFDKRAQVTDSAPDIRTLLVELAPISQVLPEDEQVRRKNTFYQETKEEYQHSCGSYWDPFYDDLADAMLNVEDYNDSATIYEFSGDVLPESVSSATGIEWPQQVFYFESSALSPTVRMVTSVRDGDTQIETIFPLVTGHGKQYTITMNKVIVWPRGFEAQIEASIGAVPITFFDCEYGQHRNLYQEGREYDFLLAAIAYDCRPMLEDESIDIKFPPDLWESMTESDNKSHDAPTKVLLKGMAMLIPIDEWDNDDYDFRGTVKSVTEWEVSDGKVWVVTVSVLREFDYVPGKDKDIDVFNLPIVVTKKVWENNAPPEVGQDIAGSLWLQGRLWRCLPSD